MENRIYVGRGAQVKTGLSDNFHYIYSDNMTKIKFQEIKIL